MTSNRSLKNNMKVLFISRATLFKDKGGDTIQAINTAKYLRKLGIEVDVRLCNEEIDYSSYQILHFFNIIRPGDILYHIEKANKPFVVSTIFVDYSEYERKARGGFAGFLSKIFSSDLIEYFKAIARYLINREKIISPSYFFLGQTNSIRKVIKRTAVLLPNSNSEYKRLSNQYRLNGNYKVIPNGIDPCLFPKNGSLIQKDPRLVICVGRIEGRKNQLNLIKALNDTEYRLVIIGSPSPNHVKYYNSCKEAASSNVSFIQNLPQEELIAYYQKAKVHALPSWIETTGLSSLEAAAMRCNIVVTDKGDTEEYFENYAFYCDPASPGSIYSAVNDAAAADFNEGLHKKIYTHYTWLHTAEKTFEAYQEALAG